jgi:PST family polysaccharide transporter
MDRGVRLSVSVLVSTWVARYLGPENFGLLNFAASLTAIFAAVVPLGIDGLVVRDLITRRENRGSLIGTTLGLRLGAAITCSLLAAAYVAIARPGDMAAMLLTVILSAGLIAQAFEAGELMFQAHTDIGRLVLPRLVLFGTLNALKVALILKGYSVFWFAALTAAEQVASGLVTAIYLKRYQNFRSRLHFTFAEARGLVRKGYPLAIAAFAVIVYMKGGQLMLAQMLGDREMGLYAAAIRFPDCALFLPTALAISVVPALLRAHQTGGAAYEAGLLAYMRLSALMGLAVALPLALAAPWLMQFLFGDAYASAWATMSVYVLAMPFMFLGVARTQHLLNEGQMRLSLAFSIIGLVINLGLNFALIPVIGKMGAAIATVASQALSAVLASFIHPASRRLGQLQCLALCTPWLALRDYRRQRRSDVIANQAA